MEPDPNVHEIFATYAEAYAAWGAMQDDEAIPREVRDAIAPPIQAVGDVWIFAKAQ